MSDDPALGTGVAAWMLARIVATELAESGVVPPKRMRKLVSTLLEACRRPGADGRAVARGADDDPQAAGGAAPLGESEPA